MKKIIFALLFCSQSFAEMGEIQTDKFYNKNKGEHSRHHQEESNDAEKEQPEDSGKKFYQALYNRIQKSNPDWSKEEVLRYIEPLWYKKLEIDKANATRLRPSLSNESEIKPKKDSN